MSKLDIVTTLLAVLYLPVLIAAACASYCLGITRGKTLSQDEASELWPQHSDYDDRLRRTRRFRGSP